MLSCGLHTAVLLCHTFIVVQSKVCQHFVGRISSEVMCLVQEARKELKVYQGLKKAAKAQKVTVNMPVCDVDCLPSKVVPGHDLCCSIVLH